MDLVAGGVKCLLKQGHGSLSEEMMFEQRPDAALCTWVSGLRHFDKRVRQCNGRGLGACKATQRMPLAPPALGLGVEWHSGLGPVPLLFSGFYRTAQLSTGARLCCDFQSMAPGPSPQLGACPLSRGLCPSLRLGACPPEAVELLPAAPRAPG